MTDAGEPRLISVDDRRSSRSSALRLVCPTAPCLPCDPLPLPYPSIVLPKLKVLSPKWSGRVAPSTRKIDNDRQT